MATGVAAAVGTEFLFEVGFSLARGTAFNPAYVGLCGLLILGAGLACVAVGVLLPGAGLRVALGLFVAAHGFADPLSGSRPMAVALAMGAATWLVVSPNRVRQMGACALGTVIGAALCIAAILWPYIHPALGIGRAPFWQTTLLPGVVFALVLASAAAWESLRRRSPTIPSFARLSAVALVLCLGGTAFAFGHMRPQSSAVRSRPAPVGAASLPDVFVLVLDTVRADHLSSYGYSRDTTPNLARFLAEHPEATQYDLAFSPASWTVPAHASLLTGTMPSDHQARSGPEGGIGDSATASLALVAEETLAETLSGVGYCTGAVVANAYLLRVDGLQRGFEAFLQPPITRPFQLLGQGLRRRFVPWAFAGRIKPYASAGAVNSNLLRIHQACGPRPSFLLANYMEAHSPYLAPSPHAGLFAGDRHAPVSLGDALLTDSDELVALKRDRYDEGLHYLDAQLGDLFAELEASGAMQGAWLVITSDHGEAFVEHQTSSHGSSIYNEQVRIPLIVKPPRGVRLPRTRGPVSLLDVTTTIAAVAGRSGFGMGHDLRQPLPAGRAVGIEFTGRFRASLEEFGATAGQPARAVVRGHWKLIERGGRYELFDLASDPREQIDRAPQQNGSLRSLAAALPRMRDHEGRPIAGVVQRLRSLGSEEEGTLRALGYVR